MAGIALNIDALVVSGLSLNRTWANELGGVNVPDERIRPDHEREKREGRSTLMRFHRERPDLSPEDLGEVCARGLVPGGCCLQCAYECGGNIS